MDLHVQEHWAFYRCFSLRNHTVVKFVNPNESSRSSLRDGFVRFKSATKAVNRSLERIKYSIALVFL